MVKEELFMGAILLLIVIIQMIISMLGELHANVNALYFEYLVVILHGAQVSCIIVLCSLLFAVKR